MWSLLHAAESFDDEPYVRDCLRVLPLLSATCSGWSEIVILRIINSEATRVQLIREVRLASAEGRAALRSVCARLYGRNDRLTEGLAEVEAVLR